MTSSRSGNELRQELLSELQKSLIREEVKSWQKSSGHFRGMLIADRTLPTMRLKTLQKIASPENVYGPDLIAQHGVPLLDLLMLEDLYELTYGLLPLQGAYQSFVHQLKDTSIPHLLVLPGSMIASGSGVAYLAGHGDPTNSITGFVAGALAVPLTLMTTGASSLSRDAIKRARAIRILERHPHLRPLAEQYAVLDSDVEKSHADKVLKEEVSRLIVVEQSNHQQESQSAQNAYRKLLKADDNLAEADENRVNLLELPAARSSTTSMMGFDELNLTVNQSERHSNKHESLPNVQDVVRGRIEFGDNR